MKKMVLAFTVIFLIVGLAGPVVAQDLAPMEELGKKLFFDKISAPDWMACATCHSPSVGFTGPIPGINEHGAVYRGAVPTRFGNRKPPSAAYATLSPIFYYDGEEDLFIGGNFWDGRATGWKLGNPAADQAQGPFLNSLEQNNASKQAVLEQVAASQYADLWEAVWGEPISYETDAEIETNYDRLGLTIAAFEDSTEVNQFSSKFDAWLMGEAELTEQKMHGLELFTGEAECAACHLANLFTDFTYDNLGVPRNPENPFYTQVDFNPLGYDWIDLGLGAFLRSLADPSNQGWRGLPYVTNVKDLTNDALLDLADDNDGKQKVPTLRNVDKRPGQGFPKAYTHNGFFKSLWSVVHFYNTRDMLDSCEALGLMNATEKVALANNCWPAPEVSENVNQVELGNLGLSFEDEMDLVAFLKTLSDGFMP